MCCSCLSVCSCRREGWGDYISMARALPPSPNPKCLRLIGDGWMDTMNYSMGGGHIKSFHALVLLMAEASRSSILAILLLYPATGQESCVMPGS